MNRPEVPAHYERPARVLDDALDQVMHGKGKQRHATDEPFEKQGMIRRNKVHRGGCLFQAAKKVEESERMNNGDKRRELLGAIMHIVGEIMTLEDEGL